MIMSARVLASAAGKASASEERCAQIGMIKVECEFCKAPYDIDERRLPATGMKMRCPKCGQSFQVMPPGGAAAATPAAPAAPPAPKGTMLGMGGVGARPAPPPPSPMKPPILSKPPAAGASLPSAPGNIDVPDLKPSPKHAEFSSQPESTGELDLDFDLEQSGEVSLPAAPAIAKPGAPKAPSAISKLSLPMSPPASPFAKKQPDFGDFSAPIPAPAAAAAAPASLDLLDELDLGSGTIGEVDSLLDDLDLPISKDASGVDLPAAKNSGFGDLNLPISKDASGVDLPAAKNMGFGDLDLPAPKDIFDLPAPKEMIDFPAAKNAFDLPAPRGEGGRDFGGPSGGRDSFGELDLPAPKADFGMPVGDLGVALQKPGSSSKKETFGDLELPAPQIRSAKSTDDVSAARPSQGRMEKVSQTLPAALSFEDMPLPELPLPDVGGMPLPPEFDGPMAAHSGDAFGEIPLPGGDDMEFGDIPQAEGQPRPGVALRPIQTDNSGAGSPSQNPNAPRLRRLAMGMHAEARRANSGQSKNLVRTIAIGGAAVVALIGGGYALSYTAYGAFGMYGIESFLPAAGTAAGAKARIDGAEKIAASDTFGDVRTSLTSLSSARREMSLNRGLITRSIVHESLYQWRFGNDASSTGRVSRMSSHLEERHWDASGAALAHASMALLRGSFDEALSMVAQARAGAGQDPYLDLIAGEANLAKGKFADAVAAFRAAGTHQGGTRATWGLARGLLAQSKAAKDPAVATKIRAEAEHTLDLVLKESPRHVAARAAKAEFALEKGDEHAAIALLQEAVGAVKVGSATLSGSPRERTEALAALGHIHEARGRLREARETYEAALLLTPSRVDALLGDARVLYSLQRYSDALTRFEAVEQAQGVADQKEGNRTALQEAKLGASKSLLALQRGQDGRATLVKLAQELPQDTEVLLELGHAEEALQNAAAAEQQYREVIRMRPDNFQGYLALAHLFISTGRANESGVVLEQATQKVPESAEMRRFLGDSELARNRLEAAEVQYRRALALSNDEPGALFGLGVTQRRGGHYVDAAKSFDALVIVDPDYPGLDLERGLVYEAQGLSARAVEAFSSALEAHPNDPELLLRLGAAQVGAMQLDEAEQTLNKVREANPHSAELEHFTGRLAFARGLLREANQHFDRAIGLDGTRAEYHLYSAWASRDEGNFGKALEEVEAALARDPSLGDAYWIRGEVRLRSGAVRDALVDLQKALQLRPTRYEAEADIGDVLDQLRDHPGAIAAFRRAVAGNPNRGDWWYRIGVLEFDSGNRQAAMEAFGRAVQIGDLITPPPGWLADSHRIFGDALRLGGDKAGAISHYERYLEIAPGTSIDRGEVTQQLNALKGN